MSKKEKKETINRVMHLLRCGTISTSTPNKDVYKFFEFEENNGWISVDDQLPPRAENSFTFSDYVLVCDNIGYMDTACYNFEKNRWDWLNNVTHWMPLPQKPVKKGGEK